MAQVSTGDIRTPSLRVFLLGRFEVERDGRPLPGEVWRRQRAVDLLKLIALAPGRALHREQVIEALWPQKNLQDGSNNLHRALHDLRRALGGAWVYMDKRVVRLRPEVWVDVEALETALHSPDPSNRCQGLALYRGDLCPDDPYSGALAGRRETLRQKFGEATLDLAARAAATGELAVATELLSRLVEVDPSHEEANRRLMQALARSGRPEEALRRFEVGVKRLKAAGASPSPQTAALYESIARETKSVQREPRATSGWRRAARRLLGGVSLSPLRGRSSELMRVEAFVLRRTGVLLLVGESGIGKTRLAVEAARIADEREAVILSAAGLELECLAPYAPFAEAWADHLRACGRSPAESPFVVFTSTPGGAPQEDTLLLFQSLTRSIETLANGRPTLIILDDVHLADPSSLHLLHYLARESRTAPVHLVVTCRTEDLQSATPLGALVASLQRERLIERLSIGKLDAAASCAHMADLLGKEPDGSLASSIYALAGGNPFYTEEVLRAFQEHDPSRGGVAVPADLAQTVRDRVERLGEDTRVFLVAAAIIGQRFDFETAMHVSRVPLERALEVLDKSLSASLIEEVEGDYRFRHGLVRDALFGTLTAARRRQVHRELASALEAQPTREDRSDVLAFHLQAAGDGERALPYLVRAGQRAAARLGLREAVTYFAQALDIMDALAVPDGPERLALLSGLGEMRVALSDLVAAVGDLDRAAALHRTTDGWRPEPSARASALRWAALALITAGELEQASDRLERALVLLAHRDGDPELPQVLYHLAQLRWHEGKHREAYEVAERALAEAEKQGVPELVARGYEMLALACHSLGEWREGARFEEQRRALVGATVDVAQAFDVHL